MHFPILHHIPANIHFLQISVWPVSYNPYSDSPLNIYIALSSPPPQMLWSPYIYKFGAFYDKIHNCPAVLPLVFFSSLSCILTHPAAPSVLLQYRLQAYNNTHYIGYHTVPDSSRFFLFQALIQHLTSTILFPQLFIFRQSVNMVHNTCSKISHCHIISGTPESAIYKQHFFCHIHQRLLKSILHKQFRI